MSKNKQHRVRQLILQGEGLHLDFKFEISDSAKIARSLVAFANTDGGTLLVGVKDNGKITGIRSEEEYYMIEQAAQQYCKPEVKFQTKEWSLDGKKILEVIIPKSQNIPHKAPDKNGKYKAYIREADENLLANGIQMKVWKKQNSKKEIQFAYTAAEKTLLQLVENNKKIRLTDYMKASGLSRYQAENILSNFILLKLVSMKINPEGCIFSAIESPEE